MDNNELKEKLVEKSIEAFIIGLEIYNKPTIKYRIEGFSFFICNAWELMLKATLLKRNESIYFSDKPDRTLSLENVVRKIYTDKNTRIRLNLEKIIELRNISTHKRNLMLILLNILHKIFSQFRQDTNLYLTKRYDLNILLKLQKN